MHLSEHFDSEEFRCKCRFRRYGPYCTGLPVGGIMDPRLIAALETIREEFGPVTVISGYRCRRYNREVGGVPSSQHLLGTAADIVVRNASPEQLGRFAAKLLVPGGVGVYKSFVHVDVRDTTARW